MQSAVTIVWNGRGNHWCKIQLLPNAGSGTGTSRVRVGPKSHIQPGVGQVNLCGCYVASWRSRLAIVSTVGWPAATSITRS